MSSPANPSSHHISPASSQGQPVAGPRYQQRQRLRTSHQQHVCFKHTPRKIEQTPNGYPRLAAFVNSHRDFALFRRYGYLRARRVLDIQDELAELEHKLEKVDCEDPRPYNLSTRRDDSNQARKQLLAQIGQKLEQYDTALNNYFLSQERTRPDDAQISSVVNWLDGNKPLVAEESKYFNDWEDLACLNEPPNAGGLERLVSVAGVYLQEMGFVKFLSTRIETSKTSDPNITLLNHRRLTKVSRIINTIAASIALTVPIIVLYYIGSLGYRLIAITAFTFSFSSLLCGFTQSRNYEIFSATAAYCAVLVVFVGNLPA